MIELKIDPEFRDKIPPLTEAEFEQLRENILADGEVYEPLVVWNGTIVDGHNRYKIVQEHPEIPFKVREEHFTDKWAAFEWMYRKQLGRRNLSEEQKDYMMGKMYEARKNTDAFKGNQYTSKSGESQNANNQNGRTPRTDEIIGAELGVNHATVHRAYKFAQGVDALREVSKEAADKVMSGNSGATKGEVREILKMSDKEKKKFAADVVSGEIKKNRRERTPSEEVQKRSAAIDAAVERITNPDAVPEYTLDDLLNELQENASSFVSMVRRMIAIRSNVLSDEVAREKVRGAIEANIINKIKEIERLV